MSVFKNQDTMIELLENAGKARRKELLDDMRYDTSDKSFPKLINIKDAQSAHDHHFVYEYDHRNLETEIDGANDPCKGLSQLNRQLTQEGDMRVFFDENKVKPIKVIKKRSLECKQGVETYSIKDENGDDRLLQADEILFKGEPTVSSEDIYDQCEKVPFDMINSRYIPPMDTWDIVLDATEAIQEMNRRCKFGIINNFNKEQQLAEISSMVYSSNVYPEIRDKRYSNKLKEKLSDIDNGAQFMKFCGASNNEWNSKIARLQSEADKLPLGKERAKLLLSIQDTKLERIQRMKISRKPIEAMENFHQLRKAERFSLAINEDRKKTKEEIIESIETMRQFDKKITNLSRKLNKFILLGNKRTQLPLIDRKVMWNIWNEMSLNRRKPTKGRFTSLLKQQLLRRMSNKMKEMKFKNISEKRQQAILFQAYITYNLTKAVHKLYGVDK